MTAVRPRICAIISCALLLLAATLFLTGCDPRDPRAALIGTWNAIGLPANSPPVTLSFYPDGTCVEFMGLPNPPSQTFGGGGPLPSRPISFEATTNRLVLQRR